MHTHTCMHTRTHTRTRTHMHARARTHTHVHPHAYTHTHTCMLTYTHACTHAHRLTRTHAHTPTRARMHWHMHTACFGAWSCSYVICSSVALRNTFIHSSTSLMFGWFSSSKLALTSTRDMIPAITTAYTVSSVSSMACLEKQQACKNLCWEIEKNLMANWMFGEIRSSLLAHMWGCTPPPT